MLKTLDGKTPQIHPTAFVSETAYLIGDVEVGEMASIWPGVVIRADSARSRSAAIPTSRKTRSCTPTTRPRSAATRPSGTTSCVTRQRSEITVF